MSETLKKFQAILDGFHLLAHEHTVRSRITHFLESTASFQKHNVSPLEKSFIFANLEQIIFSNLEFLARSYRPKSRFWSWCNNVLNNRDAYLRLQQGSYVLQPSNPPSKHLLLTTYFTSIDWRFEAVVTQGRTLYAVSPSQDSLCRIFITSATSAPAETELNSIVTQVAHIPAPCDLTWDCDKKNLYIAGLGGIWKYDILTEQCDLMIEKLERPCSIRIDKQGNLFLCDSGSLIKIDMKTRQVVTVLEEQNVISCIVDDSGTIYFASRRGICCFHNGVTTVLVAEGYRGVSMDGPLSKASITFALYLEFDTDGGILFSDIYDHKVKKLDLQRGILYTVAGTGRTGTVDGDVANPYTTLDSPKGLYRDSQSQQLYITSLHPGGTFIRVLHPTSWNIDRLFWIARYKNQESECPMAMLPPDIIRLIMSLCKPDMSPKVQHMPLPPVDRILASLQVRRKLEIPEVKAPEPPKEPKKRVSTRKRKTLKTSTIKRYQQKKRKH